jgi:hypothetical protein
MRVVAVALQMYVKLVQHSVARQGSVILRVSRGFYFFKSSLTGAALCSQTVATIAPAIAVHYLIIVTLYSRLFLLHSRLFTFHYSLAHS